MVSFSFTEFLEVADFRADLERITIRTAELIEDILKEETDFYDPETRHHMTERWQDSGTQNMRDCWTVLPVTSGEDLYIELFNTTDQSNYLWAGNTGNEGSGIIESKRTDEFGQKLPLVFWSRQKQGWVSIPFVKGNYDRHILFRLWVDDVITVCSELAVEEFNTGAIPQEPLHDEAEMAGMTGEILTFITKEIRKFERLDEGLPEEVRAELYTIAKKLGGYALASKKFEAKRKASVKTVTKQVPVPGFSGQTRKVETKVSTLSANEQGKEAVRVNKVRQLKERQNYLYGERAVDFNVKRDLRKRQKALKAQSKALTGR